MRIMGTIPFNISVQQVRFAHMGTSCFIIDVKKNKKFKNLNTNYNGYCIFDIFFEMCVTNTRAYYQIPSLDFDYSWYVLPLC